MMSISLRLTHCPMPSYRYSRNQLYALWFTEHEFCWSIVTFTWCDCTTRSPTLPRYVCCLQSIGSRHESYVRGHVVLPRPVSVHYDYCGKLILSLLWNSSRSRVLVDILHQQPFKLIKIILLNIQLLGNKFTIVVDCISTNDFNLFAVFSPGVSGRDSNATLFVKTSLSQY